MCRMPPSTQQLPAQPKWCTAMHHSACADGPAAGALRCTSAPTRELMVSLPTRLHPHCKPAGLPHVCCVRNKQALPLPRMLIDDLLSPSSASHLSGALKRVRHPLCDCSAAAGCRHLSQWQAACSRAQQQQCAFAYWTAHSQCNPEWLMAMPLTWPAVEQSC